MSEARPFVIGLTGSIGMGKSTTANMFRKHGIEVWDADEAVERLYSKGGEGVKAIAGLCPGAVRRGEVDRERLKAWIAGNPERLKKIEKVIHPLVSEDRRKFLEQVAGDIVVLDIPLLFEGGGDKNVDMVVVVTTDPETQRKRVLARPGMTEEQLDAILRRQLPDSEKRKRADKIIVTDTLESTEKAVQDLIREIREHRAHA